MHVDEWPPYVEALGGHLAKRNDEAVNAKWELDTIASSSTTPRRVTISPKTENLAELLANDSVRLIITDATPNIQPNRVAAGPEVDLLTGVFHL